MSFAALPIRGPGGAAETGSMDAHSPRPRQHVGIRDRSGRFAVRDTTLANPRCVYQLMTKRAHQPLDHGDQLGVARLVRARVVLSKLVLPHGPVRRRGMTRIIHPWIGVVLFFSFCGLFLRFWKLNLWERTDNVWLGRVRDGLTAHDEPAGGRQMQCRAEARLLVDVVPDHCPDHQRHRDLGAVFLGILLQSCRSGLPC
jgi:hypothetical protein